MVTQCGYNADDRVINHIISTYHLHGSCNTEVVGTYLLKI